MTDKDITRRVVARHADVSSTVVSTVMTKNPQCISMTDSAMEALGIMIENRYRHLPVVDDNGSVVGLLDISKCLNDAISKLERNQKKTASSVEDAVKQVANLSASGGSQSAALQMLLGPLLNQALSGNSSPTLRSLLTGKPATIVRPGTNLREAGITMAEGQKAALVVDDDELVGIVSFKDMMTRALAKELPLELTDVTSIMTADPEHVTPDTTVLEALQLMHENKFLTLPVCEEDGSVVGIVDVMDVIYGCGGADGWRAIFSSALDIADDASDAGSIRSVGSRAKSVKSTVTRGAKAPLSSMGAVKESKDERPVSKLRPNKPILTHEGGTVLDLCKMLASRRGYASLIVNNGGSLVGIMTDKDITRRVVARHADVSSTVVSTVMTKNPQCISMTDSAMEALGIMIENRYRHLPVVDDNGSVVGLLDISKCLNDAISKLERNQKKTASSVEDAVKQVANLSASGGSQSAALQMLLGPLLNQALSGNSSPTLRSLLTGKPATIVRPGTNLREAGITMAEGQKAALVVDDDELVGIVSFKDMMTRALAKELPLELTDVTSIMTADPEHVTPDTTVLEALQLMHENKFLTLPVCEEDGSVVGIVDVMDVIYGCGGADGWRAIFSASLDVNGDKSEMHSEISFSKSNVSDGKIAKVKRSIPPVKAVVPQSSLRPVVPQHVIVEDDVVSRQDSLNDTYCEGSIISEVPFVFKIVDAGGNTLRIRCASKLGILLEAVAEKLDVSDVSCVKLKFVDNEGDVVLLSSDECLSEAVRVSRSSGNSTLKLSVSIDSKSESIAFPAITNVIVISVAAFAVISLVAVVFVKRKK